MFRFRLVFVPGFLPEFARLSGIEACCGMSVGIGWQHVISYVVFNECKTPENREYCFLR